ncbi:major capsid protein [Acidovorax sp. SUPP2825]|uniref:major capsid protein n=1 Tax=Acidovorax sp. SUPP2825 TaxID=2920879 RepID=UPI0023DE4EFE|nr:major capsid protein [Acidovorax sp. SUPP2825]GKS97027.1 major capsid protein [Acidovorax sp. SUPP2825]
MTPKDVRLANPILGSLMIAGVAAATALAAPALFPRLPSALRGFQLAQLGDEASRAYNTRRAPGTATKQVRISWQGQTYTVDQHAIDVPIPRELIQESDEARRLNVGANLDISQIAVNTSLQILNTSYEMEAASLATDPAAFGPNVLALTGGTKWTADTGTPVTDISSAAESIRVATGRRPNTLVVSAKAFNALALNKQVKSYMPTTMLGPATLDQLKTILNVPNIVIADGVWTSDAGVVTDIWGNNAILAYTPNIGPTGTGLSLGEPAFGFTSWMDGHPFVETPYYDRPLKSWIYGSTFERKPTLVRGTAGFLLQNPA